MSAENVYYGKERSRRAAAEEALTMQTWNSLLAENEGSQVMDTECSKEKFFTTYKRLSCLHTSSTVKPWMHERKRTLNTRGKTEREEGGGEEGSSGSKDSTLSGWEPHTDCQ